MARFASKLALVVVAGGALAGLAAACTQTLHYGSAPTDAKLYEFKSTLEWHKVDPIGDVYMSTSLGFGRGANCGAGYFGAQFHRTGAKNMLLFSIAGAKMNQVMPVGPYCKRDCLDCGHKPREGWKDVQCKRYDVELKLHVKYDFTVEMTHQNKSGAEWQTSMKDTSSGKTYEIGRVFFLDTPKGLNPEHCRTLRTSSYSFQEYYAGFKQFTTEATWSGLTFSAELEPMRETGYCQGGAGAALRTIKQGSLAECKQACLEDKACTFASYSFEDKDYVRGGQHCMLFKTCAKMDSYKREIWNTYKKASPKSLPQATGFCKDGNIATVKGGISQAQCLKRCERDSRCKFASYSREDRGYTEDGQHCMLHATCSQFNGYLKNIWTAFEKKGGKEMRAMSMSSVRAPVVPAREADECCNHFNWGQDKSFITSRKPIAMRFHSGPKVNCVKAAVKATSYDHEGKVEEDNRTDYMSESNLTHYDYRGEEEDTDGADDRLFDANALGCMLVLLASAAVGFVERRCTGRSRIPVDEGQSAWLACDEGGNA